MGFDSVLNSTTATLWVCALEKSLNFSELLHLHRLGMRVTEIVYIRIFYIKKVNPF